MLNIFIISLFSIAILVLWITKFSSSTPTHVVSTPTSSAHMVSTSTTPTSMQLIDTTEKPQNFLFGKDCPVMDCMTLSCPKSEWVTTTDSRGCSGCPICKSFTPIEQKIIIKKLSPPVITQQIEQKPVIKKQQIIVKQESVAGQSPQIISKKLPKPITSQIIKKEISNNDGVTFGSDTIMTF